MSNADYATSGDYGTCPECGKTAQLTRRGALRYHTLPNGLGNRVRCPGSGKPPAK